MTNEQENLVAIFKERIQSALNQFGAYTFSDKGAYEVMDLDECARDLEKFSPTEQGEILNATLEGDYGDLFVGAMLIQLQDLPDAEFEELLSVGNLSEHY